MKSFLSRNMKRFGRVVLATAALGGFLLLGAAPRAVADDDSCRHRLVRADHRLHEAAEHHGWNSPQAEHARHELHQAREYWLQHRRGQFEDKSRLAADSDSQQSAAVAVGLAAVVLNPGVKRRCGCGIDTERKPSAFIPDEHRFVNPDTDEPLRVARANAMRRRRMETASSVEAGEELSPVGRVMRKRGEDLARRSVHIDGGIKADWSGDPDQPHHR